MKKLLIPIVLSLFCFLFFPGCEHSNPNWVAESDQPDLLHRSLKKITDVIVHDIFSPPVASRIYAYSNIAAYEALAAGNEEYQSLAGQLRDLSPVPQPVAGQEYCYPLAATKAMLRVGKALIFSEDMIDAFEADLLKDFDLINMPKSVYNRSLAYGDSIALHILDWADKDNYKQTRTFPKFTINDDASRWRPTPPDYMDAIEPHWNKIRSFTLDSANQFVPPPPTPFDMKDKKGKFYEEVMEVYKAIEVDNEIKEERVNIAKFWDCNPYVSHHKGHVMFATKKITPGGHWMGISQIACKKAKADMMTSAKAYMLTSIALADAFISCWDEKYRSELIRPETVINTYIDQEWAPILQTPPFPEYTSGHSVISAAAASALTSVFGENFSYTDSVEVEYGMPVREFESFQQASDEAAVSRLYGGIHYAPACFIGVDQGKMVGKHVLGRIKTN